MIYNKFNFKSENSIFSNEKRSSLGIKGDCTVIKKNETHLEFSEMACNMEAYFICEVGKSTACNSSLLFPLKNIIIRLFQLITTFNYY